MSIYKEDFDIEVKIIEEAGYHPAIDGLLLNKKQDNRERCWVVAKKLAPKDYGHNKFLEMLDVWVEVKAPRYWWQEADTYRLTVKSSESTMHTLIKGIKGGGFDSTHFECRDVSASEIRTIRHRVGRDEPIEKIKRILPEGFMQTRVWKLNYKNIRNIMIQRGQHKLPHWRYLCQFLKDNLRHRELVADIHVNPISE
jgi:hypothetical protein